VRGGGGEDSTTRVNVRPKRRTRKTGFSGPEVTPGREKGTMIATWHGTKEGSPKKGGMERRGTSLVWPRSTGKTISNSIGSVNS